MTNKVKTHILPWVSGIACFTLLLVMLYSNFGPRQDFSAFLPLDLFRSLGINDAVIKVLRHNSDKVWHFLGGLIFTLTLFFSLRHLSVIEAFFTKRISSAFFIMCFFIAEIGQDLFRLTICDINKVCCATHFSFSDIAAGSIGCLITLYGISIWKSVR